MAVGCTFRSGKGFTVYDHFVQNILISSEDDFRIIKSLAIFFPGVGVERHFHHQPNNVKYLAIEKGGRSRRGT